MSALEPTRILSGDLDRTGRFEWLALEAAWSTAQSPFTADWERWQVADGYVDEPDSIVGAVVTKNLRAAHSHLDNAYALNTFPEERQRIRAHAVEHVGAMAGGLIRIAAQFDSPRNTWHLPLDDHLEAHFVATAESMQVARMIGRTSLEERDYIPTMTGVAERVTYARSDTALQQLAGDVLQVAGLAINTWERLLDADPTLEVLPGATPRTTGDHIDHLRLDFARFEPAIAVAAIERAQ